MKFAIPVAVVVILAWILLRNLEDRRQETENLEVTPAIDSAATSEAEGSTGQLEWFDGYDGHSVEELVALEGKYRVDSLVSTMNSVLLEKMEQVGAESMSEEEMIVMAVEAMTVQVNNGGYLQFFSNSSGRFTPIIVEALRRIGCQEAGRIDSGSD